MHAASRTYETSVRRASLAGTRRMVIALQMVTASVAAFTGALLALAPDGHLLDADPDALRGTPFGSWRVPGILLLVLVGGGLTAAAFALWRRTLLASLLSTAAGLGLAGFEICGWAWLGFQPLAPLFVAVGLLIAHLARRLR